MIRCRRIYLPASPDDGARVLVERLWPRGLRKADAQLDLWLKTAAPSPDLRRWYGHDPARWAEFQARYRAELAANTPVIAQLCTLAAQGNLTLVHAARDQPGNSTQVVCDYLQALLAR